MGRKGKAPVVSGAKSRIIGIAGVGHGVGCTHFAVMLGNYLAGYERKPTALLEFNDSGAFARLKKVCVGKDTKEGPFRILEADYYGEAEQGELARVIERQYAEILIDFGDVQSADWACFLRCDRKFLIGSFSEWQQERFREFELKKRPAEKKSWQSLAAFGSEETRREFSRRYRIFTERIPFSADAFAVTEECGSFFRKLLGEQQKRSFM